MKTIINTRFICVVILLLFLNTYTLAQQSMYSKPENTSSQNLLANAKASYTYKIFQAPNKIYGFDVLKNGKFIFHQPASNVPPGSNHPAIATKEDAEKAANFFIDKIKKGQQSFMLTDDEIKKIITQ